MLIAELHCSLASEQASRGYTTQHKQTLPKLLRCSQRDLSLLILIMLIKAYEGLCKFQDLPETCKLYLLNLVSFLYLSLEQSI